MTNSHITNRSTDPRQEARSDGIYGGILSEHTAPPAAAHPALTGTPLEAGNYSYLISFTNISRKSFALHRFQLFREHPKDGYPINHGSDKINKFPASSGVAVAQQLTVCAEGAMKCTTEGRAVMYAHPRTYRMATPSLPHYQNVFCGVSEALESLISGSVPIFHTPIPGTASR
jgi:hypothetical protein